MAGWTFVDESADRAEEKAREYVGGYWDSIIQHYQFDQPHLMNTPGYEHHGLMYERLTAEGGMEAMTDFFVGLQLWGTPDQVTEKIVDLQDKTPRAQCHGTGDHQLHELLQRAATRR